MKNLINPFKPGDRVVCVEFVKWDIGYGPRKNEVLVVHDVYKSHLCFLEYGNGQGFYNPTYFAPVQDATEMEFFDTDVKMEDVTLCNA